MEVPQDVIDMWPSVWQQICDMAYYRKNITTHIIHINERTHPEFLAYENNSKNFDQLTLDYTWKQASSVRNTDGTPIEAQVVPELREIYVPRVLFDTLGVFSWFNHSFPNCSILFWEDDS
jgi:hypothetical protein